MAVNVGKWSLFRGGPYLRFECIFSREKIRFELMANDP